MSASTESLPWYSKAPVAVAAWFSALLFAAFLCAVVAMGPGFDEGLLFVLGLVCLAASAALSRVSTGLFTDQLALAISGGAHAATLIGYSGTQGNPGPWLFPMGAAVLCAGLYHVHRQAMHRFLSVLAVLALTFGWLCVDHAWISGHLVAAGSVLLAGYLLTAGAPGEEYRPAILALATGGAIAALAHLHPSAAWLYRVRGADPQVAAWIGAAALAAGMLAFLAWAAGGWEPLRRPPFSITCTVVVGLAALGMPGVLIALGLMTIGFLRKDTSVSTLGLVLLPLFLGGYYYNLAVDLYTKSFLLMGSGVTLLLARLALPKEVEA